MSGDNASDEIEALLDESDAAFAAGDADAWASCFAADGRVFLLHRDVLDGQAAIREAWEGFFSRHDTSAWEPQTDRVQAHGDHAYVFRTYTERLLNREDGSRALVRGRVVYWLRREPGGGVWRIILLMNSHSHPVEPIE